MNIPNIHGRQVREELAGNESYDAIVRPELYDRPNNL
jgi:hypothetical protein